MIKGKKIYITGGAGFIGAALIGGLVEHNQIVTLDNLERNSIKSKSFANHKNLSICVGDILDGNKIGASLSKDTDIVINCAAVAGIFTVIKKPTNTMKVNMIGSANILEAASGLSQCQRVVCFSSCEVLGQYTINAHENDNAVIGRVGEARWTYAASKLAEEHLAMAYYHEKNLPITILRPFNIYGPGQVGESAMRTFIIRALRNEPLEIHGDGTQVRTWCYVDDMVDATIQALDRPKAIGELFNIGNNQTIITVFDLATMITRELNSKSPVVFKQKNYVDVELRIPAVQKAREILGFEAKIDLVEGIHRTAEYYQTCLE